MNIAFKHLNAHMIERRSIVAASGVSAQLRRAALAKRWDNLQRTIELRYVPILTEAMTASHLLGIQKSRQYATAVVQAGLLSSAIGWLEKRLGITPAQEKKLQKVYTHAAVRVCKDVSSAAEKRLKQVVKNLTVHGAHTREGIHVLRDEFENLGLSKTKDYQLEAIFRTQTQLALNAGRYEADQDEAVQEILWGYRYETAGDDRVRPNHAAMDGVTLPKNDDFWQECWPPNGWNCRCTVIPLFEREAIVLPGDDAIPDEGFGFNAGTVFQEAA